MSNSEFEKLKNKLSHTLSPGDLDDLTECSYEAVHGTKHPQKRIKHDKYDAEVDESISDLILCLWRLDVPTKMSCQRNLNDRIWINFFTIEDCLVFLESALRHSNDKYSLYDRALANSHRLTEEDKRLDWTYDTVFESGFDVNNNLVVDYSYSVRFPISDYHEVLSNVVDTLEHSDITDL